MKHLAPLLLLCASCGTVGTTRVMAVGGKSDLGSDQRPSEEQSVAGLEVSHGPKGGGFGFEVGARYGRDSGTDGATSFTTESYEYYGGARYEWRINGWSPFVSAGLTELHLRGRSTGVDSAHDTDIGFYAAAGGDYHFGDGWHFGGSLRKTVDHDLNLQGGGDADAWQYLLRLGYAF